MPLDKKTIADFLDSKDAFEEYSPMLKALWYDGNGDWKTAHDQVDSLDGRPAARIHAYLHRKEGDEWNADYWYRRAGEDKPNWSVEQEWEELLLRYLK